MNRHTIARATMIVLTALVVAGLLYGGFWWLTIVMPAP